MIPVHRLAGMLAALAVCTGCRVGPCGQPSGRLAHDAAVPPAALPRSCAASMRGLLTAAHTHREDTMSLKTQDDPHGEMPAGDAAQRRQAVLSAAARGAAAVPLLEEALQDESPLVRRAAVRALCDLGAPAEEALEAALGSDDPVVRQAALLALARRQTAITHLAAALDDANPRLRELAARVLVRIEPRDARVQQLLGKAAQDPADPVRAVAMSALEPEVKPFEALFQRETVLLRDRPDMADHLARIRVTHRIPLPPTGWRFRRDSGRIGHREEWYAVSFDDSGWEETVIEEPWEKGYIGVGWYRLRLTLPDEPARTAAAELVFEGVDENAWVWVNGVFVGAHAIGPSGWNKPFRLDVTAEVNWGESNCIVVRAMNTKGAGGIWKPVALETLSVE